MTTPKNLKSDPLVINELDELIPFGLGIRLEIFIVDQPRTDFRIGPRAPDGVSGIVEVVTTEIHEMTSVHTWKEKIRTTPS